MTFARCFKIFAATLSTLLLLTAAGCGQKPAPEPPLTNSRLILQILSALKKQSHETAYNQICRLTAIEKNDVFLGTLKNSELCNMYIEKCQEEIDKMRLPQAKAIIDKALLTYGRNKTFMDALTAIDSLNKIQALAPQVEYPKSGLQLEKDAAEMVAMLEKLPGSGPYIPMIKEKLELAKAMQLIENERALFSLYAEMTRFRQEGNQRMADLLAAELSAGQPSHHMLQLADWLKDNAGDAKP